MFLLTLGLVVCLGSHASACGSELYKLVDLSKEEQAINGPEGSTQFWGSYGLTPQGVNWANSEKGPTQDPYSDPNQITGREEEDAQATGQNKRIYAPSPRGLIRVFPGPVFGNQVSEYERIPYARKRTYSRTYFQALMFAQQVAKLHIMKHLAAMSPTPSLNPSPPQPNREPPPPRHRGIPPGVDDGVDRNDPHDDGRAIRGESGGPGSKKMLTIPKTQQMPGPPKTKQHQTPPPQYPDSGPREHLDDKGNRYPLKEGYKQNQAEKQPVPSTGHEELANLATQPVQDYEENTPDNEAPDSWAPHQRPLDKLNGMIVIPLAYIDGHYLGTMTIGRPEQTVTVLFDTGSANLCVMSSDACSQTPCDKNRPFVRSQSTTHTEMGEPIEINFAGNTRVVGITGKDHVTLGVGKKKFNIYNQEMIEASEFEGIFSGFDVLFGLDMRAPPMMEGRPTSPLYQMTKQFGSAPVFGIYLNKWFPDESKMTFGGGKDPLAATDFHDHPVIKVDIEEIGEIYNGWNIAVDKWVVEGGKSVTEIPVPEGVLARPNSGLSIITGPVEVAHAINQAIFSFAPFEYDKQEFTFACLADMNPVWRDLPDVSIVMNEVKYTLEPHDYIGMRFDKCASLIEPVDQDLIILGWPFMMKYYTRFDQGKKKIQFAEAVQTPSRMIDALKQLRREGTELLIKKQNEEEAKGEQGQTDRREGVMKMQ